MLWIIFGMLATIYGIVAAKHISTLVGNFRLQSFFLCVFIFMEAFQSHQLNLYAVAGVLLLTKVILIPFILMRIGEKINTDENLGFVINPSLSILATLVFTYFAWKFTGLIFIGQPTLLKILGTTAFLMLQAGFFIMVFRLKAIAQIVGLLVMENGIFLLSSAAGGVPLLVELAVFFDVFVGVIILGIFVYRINKLFVGIDISKLNRLKG